MARNPYFDPYNCYSMAGVHPGYDIAAPTWAAARGPVYGALHKLAYGGLEPLPLGKKMDQAYQATMARALEEPPAPGDEVFFDPALLQALHELGAALKAGAPMGDLLPKWGRVELLLPPSVGEIDPAPEGVPYPEDPVLKMGLKRLRRLVAYNRAVLAPGRLTKARKSGAARTSAAAVQATLLDLRALSAVHDAAAGGLRRHPGVKLRTITAAAYQLGMRPATWPPPTDDPAVRAAAERAGTRPADLAPLLDIQRGDLDERQLAALQAAGLVEPRPGGKDDLQRSARFWQSAEEVAAGAIGRPSETHKRVMGGF